MPRILSTKNLTGSQRNLLDQAGISWEELPLIQVDFLTFKLKNPPENIILTSQNALKSLLDSEYADTLRTRRFFCLGPKTSELLREEGFHIEVVAHNALDLAEIIKEKYRGDTFLFLSGNMRRNELSDELHKEGIRLEEVVVYETRLQPCKVEQDFDSVMFFSPSGVRSFYIKNAKHPIKAFCIGKTTAAEALSYTDEIITAKEHSVEGVITEIISYYNNPRK